MMRAHASPPALRELRQRTFAFCSLLKTLNLNSAASRPSLGATVQRPKLLPASAKNLSRYVARQKKRARKKSCNAHTSRSVTPRTVTHACVQNTAQKAVTQKSPRITPAPGTPWKSTAKCSMTHTNPPPRDTYTRHSCASHPQKKGAQKGQETAPYHSPVTTPIIGKRTPKVTVTHTGQTPRKCACHAYGVWKRTLSRGRETSEEHPGESQTTACAAPPGMQVLLYKKTDEALQVQRLNITKQATFLHQHAALQLQSGTTPANYIILEGGPCVH